MPEWAYLGDWYGFEYWLKRAITPRSTRRQLSRRQRAIIRYYKA